MAHRVLFFITALAVCASARAQDDAALAAEALAAFEAKCTQCHGPQLERPKGRFGFVTDLTRLAADPDFIVPGQPQDSYLWTQIADGQMPPAKARNGPLTTPQRDAILAWIKAGAPTPPTTVVSGAGPTGAPVSSGPSQERASGRRAAEGTPPALRALEFVGRFHVLVIHFPIALLIAAAAGEIWAAAKKQRAPLIVVRFCLTLGTAAAVVAGGLGWLHSLDRWGEPWTFLWLHRWIGTGVAVIAPPVAWLSERDARRGVRTGATRVAIIIAATLVAAAGHFGGMLTYGADFFTP